jgi:sulfur carrier protein
MKLLLNGEERHIADIVNIADLVSALGLDARKVAVERNLEIAPRSTYADTAPGRRRPNRNRDLHRRRLGLRRLKPWARRRKPAA